MAIQVKLSQVQEAVERMGTFRVGSLWSAGSIAREGGLLNAARLFVQTVGDARMMMDDQIDAIVAGYAPETPVEII